MTSVSRIGLVTRTMNEWSNSFRLMGIYWDNGPLGGWLTAEENKLMCHYRLHQQRL